MSKKEKYEEFTLQNARIPVFYLPWWLDQVCGPANWDVAIAEDKGGNITGILPYYRRTLRSIPVVTNPLLTPFQGILLFYPINQSSVTSRYSFENRVIRELEEQLPRNVFYMNISFHPNFDNWYPFYWRNYTQTIRYTYILEDLRDVSQVFDQFSNTLKRQIQKATEQFEIHESEDVALLFRMQHASLSRHNIKTPFDLNFLTGLYHTLKEKGFGRILIAHDLTGKPVAGMLLVNDTDCAYCLVLGMESETPVSDAVKLLLWESVKIASESVNCYNFEGSMVQSVERVYRSFGGKRISYYNISWYRSKWFKALFALMKK